MNYRESGNKQGIPIIFIHAFPLSQAMWDDQVIYLQKIARTITFDIRGLGKNEDTTPYTLEFVVDDLISLLDQLKIEKAVVCGLSMGGYVVLRAIQRNPERFLGMVLADTKSGPDTDKSKLSRYEAIKTIQEKGLSTYIDNFLKSSMADDVASRVFERTKKLAQLSNPRGVTCALLALISRTDTTPGLKDIQIPTLILQGELDTTIPMAEAKSLHEQIKGSSFFIIPRAAHLSNLENPEEFNAKLISFLNGLKYIINESK